MADTFTHRAWHPPSDEYVYWTAPEWDPAGAHYSGSVPFYELEHPVITSSDTSGGGGGGGTMRDEDLSDQFDGITDSATLGTDPPNDEIMIYVNGVLQQRGTHYTLNGDTITFGADSIPHARDTVTAVYVA